MVFTVLETKKSKSKNRHCGCKYFRACLYFWTFSPSSGKTRQLLRRSRWLSEWAIEWHCGVLGLFVRAKQKKMKSATLEVSAFRILKTPPPSQNTLFNCWLRMWPLYVWNFSDQAVIDSEFVYTAPLLCPPALDLNYLSTTLLVHYKIYHFIRDTSCIFTTKTTAVQSCWCCVVGWQSEDMTNDII